MLAYIRRLFRPKSKPVNLNTTEMLEMVNVNPDISYAKTHMKTGVRLNFKIYLTTKGFEQSWPPFLRQMLNLEREYDF